MSTSAPIVDPSRTALLVMDYQNGIVGMLPAEQRSALVERASAAMSSMRGARGTVGHVRVGFTAEEAAAVPSANKMFSALPVDQMTANGTETAVVDELTPHPEDVVVRKTRVGAFPTTDLLEQLRQRGVTTLVLAGFATSGVVLSTVRDAADRDFGLVVLSDACGDGDQQVHEVLVEKVFPRQADVLTVAEFQQTLAG